MAKTEHLDLLMRGPASVWEWRKAHPGVGMDLSGADLRHADWESAMLPAMHLDGADLRGVNLAGISCSALNAERADLTGAELYGAHLAFSSFVGANLSKAGMQQVYLHAVQMKNAVLRGADIMTTVFSSMTLSGVDFAGAKVGSTVFSDVCLAGAKGLAEVVHKGPSTIGVDTLVCSRGDIPEVFLRGCGVPEPLIQNVTGLFGKAADHYTCFISNAEADDAFSARLYCDLQREGVRCWRWREDSKWGSKLMKGIDHAIRSYDRLILVCSRASLQSEPVIREVERALQKELRDRKDVLFPITLDDHVFDWEHELAADVRRRHIGKFPRRAGTKDYDTALKRLIRDLRRSSSGDGFNVKPCVS